MSCKPSSRHTQHIAIIPSLCYDLCSRECKVGLMELSLSPWIRATKGERDHDRKVLNTGSQGRLQGSLYKNRLSKQQGVGSLKARCLHRVLRVVTAHGQISSGRL